MGASGLFPVFPVGVPFQGVQAGVSAAVRALFDVAPQSPRNHPHIVRQVDYCSGALLATPRALFHELGGFDTRYTPGYYEDVDYCFRVRKKGYGVYYQPASQIVHKEGGTSGTDPTKGIKRYQALNQKKFAERWSHVLDRQPERPEAGDRLAWQQLAVRRS